jgi:hypothetical protein
VQRIFVIDDEAVIATTSRSAYLLWKYGRSFEEGIQKIQASTGSILSSSFGEDIPHSKQGVSAELFFRGKDIKITSFEMSPSQKSGLNYSKPTVVITAEQNRQGVSLGTTIPEHPGKEVVRVFYLDSRHIIAVTSCGGCYFITSI